MLLNDPVTLLLVIIPFGLMTTLMLCLSYVGTSTHRAPLHWWIAGDLVLAAYRAVDLLQPGVLPQGYESLALFAPQTAFVASTAGLLLAIGFHTLALHQLSERPRSHAWHARILLAPVLLYGIGARVLLHNPFMLSWFFLFCVVTIGIQFWVTWPLRTRFRGAWALLAGHAALLLFHGHSTVTLAMNPPGPLSFEEPDMFSLPALAMDFMVSFLFTLSFALMLQEQLRQQVMQLSITDTLTGALNRRGAVSTLFRQDWHQSALQRYPLSVAMIDLDNFKQINDQHGHLTGDTALQTFAGTVKKLKRKDDVFVRWGGEEFLLVFPGTDIQQAQVFMTRLRDALSVEKRDGALPFPIGFSAGLAQSSSMNSQQDFEALLRSVDKALYRAKRVRGRVELVEAVDL
jgi:diguanylate cyclase (GGDEF)-like protein